MQLSDGTLILFADDILLFRPIRNALDIKLLQEDVNALCNWVCSNFLCFNVKKCKQMLAVGSDKEEKIALKVLCMKNIREL